MVQSAKPQPEPNEPESDPEEWEETAFMFYSHIWALLQQNTFFIEHGYYVFGNGERWTIEELDKWARSDDKESAMKEVLQ